MKTKSRKSGATARQKLPSLARGSYCKAYVRVPVPPEVARWQPTGAGAEPFRQITQERAQAITGKSLHTVRRWAHGHQPIDVTSLRLLQVWVWGIIPSQAFIDQGVFIKYADRFTLDHLKRPQDVIIGPHDGRAITVYQVLGFHWLATFYQSEVKAWQAATADQAAERLPKAKIIPIAEYLRPRPAPDADAGLDLA